MELGDAAMTDSAVSVDGEETFDGMVLGSIHKTGLGGTSEGSDDVAIGSLVGEIVMPMLESAGGVVKGIVVEA